MVARFIAIASPRRSSNSLESTGMNAQTDCRVPTVWAALIKWRGRTGYGDAEMTG
jgi:hypothetical protein